MITLENTREGHSRLLSAWLKSRSVAAEGGYLDLLEGLGERWIADEGTGDMLTAFIYRRKVCGPTQWLNLAHLVSTSSSWQTSLAAQGFEMPTREAVLASEFGVQDD